MGIEYRGSRVVYYRKRWRQGTAHSEYVASGDLALLAYALDQADRAEQQAQRRVQQQQLAQLEQATAPPAALLDHAGIVHSLVRAVLEAHGYHQHKRQWRKRRMHQLTDGKPTRAEFSALFARVGAADSTDADRTALRRVVAAYPEYGRAFDLSELALRQLIDSTSANPAGVAIAIGRMEALRTELSGPAPSVLERLLIDQVLLDYFYLNTIAYQSAKLMAGGDTSTAAIEFWDRRLDSAQRRYVRAIETLARVRRLLRLPGPQVNINLPGGQQVNVAGSMKR
jgi:hypothetical protein